jgi:hypothetical protein
MGTNLDTLESPQPRRSIELPARSKIVKTTINLPEESMDLARYLAAVHQTRVGVVMRRALELKKFFHDTVAGGSQFLIQEKDNTIHRILIL